MVRSKWGGSQGEDSNWFCDVSGRKTQCVSNVLQRVSELPSAPQKVVGEQLVEVKGVGVPAFGRRAVWQGAGVPTRKRTLAGGTYGVDALSCGCVLKPTQARASLMFGQVSGSPRLAAGHLSAGMKRFQRHGQHSGVQSWMHKYTVDI